MDNIGVSMIIPYVIFTKLKSTPSCPFIKCDVCQLARTIQQNPGVIKQAVVPDKEANMLWDKYDVGNFISEAQFFVKTNGCLTSVYCCDISHLYFHGRSVF